MRKSTRNFLSVILTVAMLATLLVVPATAEEADTSYAASITRGEAEPTNFQTLPDAIAAAQDGDTVELLKDQVLTSQIVIEKDITINGNNFTLTTSSVQRLIWLKADVTINDLTITNTCSGGRCIETRVGGIKVNLNNVTLNAAKGSTQALTVGGNAGTDGDVLLNLNGCHIETGSIGYGIITFNPVQLTIENSTAVSGYGALYMKGAVSSLGSAGSVVNIKSSFLTSNGRDDGYTFGTVIFEESNITLNVDEKSKIIATNPENSTGMQFAIMISDKDHYFAPAVYTGITVNIAGLIDADYYIFNLISLENTVYIPAEYKAAVEDSAYLTTAAGNSLIRVWAAHTHDLEKTDAVDGNCTTDGNEEYYTCNICKKVFADENAEKEISADSTLIPATGHNAKLIEAKSATCTKDGWIEHYLCGCGYALVKLEDGTFKEIDVKDTVIPAGHNYTSHVYAEESTCTKEGCVEYWACNDCEVVEIVTENGRVESTQDKTRLPLKDHTIVKVEAKAATYSQPGNIEHYKCSTCSQLFANAEGTQDAENVVIPQLIQVEENKAQVSTDAVDNALADALEKAETTGKPAEVVIQLPTVPENDSAEEAPAIEQVQLPTTSLEEVAQEDASLTVVMPNAAATIDAKALNAIADQAAGSAITLSITQIETAELSDAQQAAIEKLDVAATIQAELICVETQKNIWTAENNATQENTGTITVKIPFAPAEGTKGSDYKVFYVADDGSVKAIDTTYQDGHLIFALEHFSEYVVVNTALSPDTGDKTMLMPMILLMVLSAACFTVMVVGKDQLLVA